ADNVQVRTTGTVNLHNMKTVQNAAGNLVVVSRSGELIVNDTAGREREKYKLPYGAVVSLAADRKVEAGQVVANWDPHTHPIITEVAGRVAFTNMEEGLTVRRQTDEITGLSSLSVIDPAERSSAAKELRPAVTLLDENGKELCIPGTTVPAHYFLPANAIIAIQDGVQLNIGDVIARIPQEGSK